MGQLYQTPPSFWQVFMVRDPERAATLESMGSTAPSPETSPHLGPRLSAGEVRRGREGSTDLPCELPDGDLERVWAYELPELVEVEVSADRGDQLRPALGDVLTATLGFQWSLTPGFDGALWKYGLLHVHLPAPPQGTSPMAIEVAAEVTQIAGAPRPREPWPLMRHQPGFDEEPPGWPMTARISGAAYANAPSSWALASRSTPRKNTSFCCRVTRVFGHEFHQRVCLLAGASFCQRPRHSILGRATGRR